jgi:hypothetical protein
MEGFHIYSKGKETRVAVPQNVLEKYSSTGVLLIISIAVRLNYKLDYITEESEVGDLESCYPTSLTKVLADILFGVRLIPLKKQLG